VRGVRLQSKRLLWNPLRDTGFFRIPHHFHLISPSRLASKTRRRPFPTELWYLKDYSDLNYLFNPTDWNIALKKVKPCIKDRHFPVPCKALSLRFSRVGKKRAETKRSIGERFLLCRSFGRMARPNSTAHRITAAIFDPLLTPFTRQFLFPSARNVSMKEWDAVPKIAGCEKYHPKSVSIISHACRVSTRLVVPATPEPQRTLTTTLLLRIVSGNVQLRS